MTTENDPLPPWIAAPRIASDFGVSPRTISDIVRLRAWKEVGT